MTRIDPRDADLDVRISHSAVETGPSIADELSYASGRTRVTATLLRPAVANPAPPGLLMLHWGFGDRSSFLSEGLIYARAGALVLTIDAEGAGDRGAKLPRLDQPDIARAYLLQGLEDLRRGLDVLIAQGAAPDRLGFVGHSLGAAIGVPFVGAEQRLSTAVLMTPLGELSRGGWALKPSAHYVETMRPLDGVHTIGAANASLSLQFASKDPWVTREAADRLCAAAPKAEARWYDADHRLSPAALADRAAWLCARLHVPPPPPQALANVRLPRRDVIRHAIAAPLFRLAKTFAMSPA